MIEIKGSELNQWDTGRGVVVKGIEAEYVHLANQGDSKAVIMGLVDIDAKIPDFLLQTGKPLCVYAVRDGVTLESKMFSVKKRPRPENYVYEEDQRNFIYTLIENAQEATEMAAQAAQAAVEMANQASQEAVEIVNKAAAAATQAGQSAVESAGVATQAAAIANEAAEDTKKATDNANEAAGKAIRASNACMVIGKAEGESITLDDAIEQYLMGCRIFGKTTQDGVPTPAAPVPLVSAGDGSLHVRMAGKNLLRCSAATTTSRGITFSVASDGTITVNGTATENAYLTIGTVNLHPGKYLLRGNSSGSSTTHRIFITNGTSEYNNYTADREFTVTVSSTWTARILVNTGTAVSNLKLYPMVRLAAIEDAEYERYKTATEMTIATPNGLRGIPVSSGGNYTDANGQQWICDEVDLARGAYVQRCEELVIDGSGYVGVGQHSNGQYYCTQEAPGIVVLEGNAPQMVLCDRYIASPWTNKNNRAYCIGRTMVLTDNRFVDKETAISILSVEKPKCMYALGSPIETPLSAEEIAAYKELHTYRESTTASNDAGAYMEIEYVMDAKKYIDGLFTGGILPATVE